MKVEEFWVLWGESVILRLVGRGVVCICVVDVVIKYLCVKLCIVVIVNMCGVVMLSVKNV